MLDSIARIVSFLGRDVEWIVFVLVFATASMIVYALLVWLLGGKNPVQRRFEEITQGHPDRDIQPHKEGMFDVRWVKPIAKLILPNEDWQKSRYITKLVQAGLRGERTLYIFLIAKVVLAVAIPVVIVVPLLLLGQIPMNDRATIVSSFLVAALAGYYLPDGYIYQKIKERQLAFIEGFPDAMDMLVVCVEAGLGLDAAIQRVGKEIIHSHKELANEFDLVSLELRAGKTRKEALRALGDRTGVEQVQSLTAILIQAENFGTSVASALREHAGDMRTKRIQIAKERAAKLPVKMLFPIILFIFPALFLVVLGPAVVRIADMFANVL